MSHTDDLLREAVEFLRSAYCFTTADSSLLPEKIKAFIAKIYAAKRPKLSDAPCSQCGYNGPGYYQAKTHPCAKIDAAKGDECAHRRQEGGE